MSSSLHRPLDIALVSEHASPLAVIGGVDSGGQNVHVAALSTALARRGHAVTVYTRDDGTVADRVVRTEDGFVVEHVPAGPAAEVGKDELLQWMPDFGDYLAARFAERRPDVVHAHFWMSGLAAMQAARRYDVPVVQTFHALGVVKRRYQGTRDTSPPERLRLEQSLARSVDRVLATCSDEVFELMRLGLAKSAISVVPCGVDTELFRVEGPAAPRSDRPRLLAVSRLVERKGVDDVIRALRRLRSAELVIAGGPPPGQLDRDPELRRLRALASALGVADRVLFLGRVERRHLPDLIRSADLVVSVPWYEPFGMVPLEAMACGVPVVASAVGGLVDTVVDGVTGVLVPARRPDVLAGTLRRLLDDPFRRAAYGAAGADRARVRYAWDRVAGSTEAVYQEVRSVAAAGAATQERTEVSS